MSVYLDSSALVKLVFVEPETSALRAALATLRPHVTSALSEVELMRVAHRVSVEHVTKVREVLDSLNVVMLGQVLLRAAGNLLPGTSLRSLDAIHLAAATAIPNLDFVIAYDRRLLAGAAELGLACLAPGAEAQGGPWPRN